MSELRWFDVEFRHGSGGDSDEFRRYAIEAHDAEEARAIGISQLPEPECSIGLLDVDPDEVSGVYYDYIFEYAAG